MYHPRLYHIQYSFVFHPLQLMEQRSMLEVKDALVAKTNDKLTRNAKIQVHVCSTTTQV